MIANLVRNARPRLLALLAAPDGDLAAAEDAFSDAVEKALREWPTTGVPANPEAWLFTVARNRRPRRSRFALSELLKSLPGRGPGLG